VPSEDPQTPLSDTDAAELPAAPSRGRAYAGFALRASLGLAVVGLLLWRYNPHTIVSLFARERPAYFGLACAIYLSGLFLSSFRWQLLARLIGLDDHYLRFVRYYFIGAFTNLFVPGLIGGDAARAIYLGRRNHRVAAAVASVVADRGVGTIALFWLAGIAAIPMASTLPTSLLATIVGVGLATIAGFFCAPLINRLLGATHGRLKALADIVAPYLGHPTSLLPAIGLSLILQIDLAIAQWVLALGLGLTIPLRVFLLSMPIANAFASIPITLNGLGLREATYLVMLGLAGVSHGDAVALGLLWFVATALSGLTGIVPFLMTGTPTFGRKALD
jgi:glycosyltransferase 2 family protein